MSAWFPADVVTEGLLPFGGRVSGRAWQCDLTAVWHEPIIVLRPEAIVIGAESRIDAFVKLEGGQGLTIGRGVHVASFAHLGIGGGRTILGDYSAVASGGRVLSGSARSDMWSMSASSPASFRDQEIAETIIGPYAAVLVNAVVLPGVRLHEGSILAAGAVAIRDIPAWEIWGGIPARFLRRRTLRGAASDLA
jgi:galactoside O-acetyltransferase